MRNEYHKIIRDISEQISKEEQRLRSELMIEKSRTFLECIYKCLFNL